MRPHPVGWPRPVLRHLIAALLRKPKKQRTYLPILEQLEDRTTPSIIAPAFPEQGLDKVIVDKLANPLGDSNPPANLPNAGGGSAPQATPPSGGGGGGRGGRASGPGGDSGFMGGAAARLSSPMPARAVAAAAVRPQTLHPHSPRRLLQPRLFKGLVLRRRRRR